MNRKTGFAESGKNLFRGFYSGVTGIVTKPIEGGSRDGFEGLLTFILNVLNFIILTLMIF